VQWGYGMVGQSGESVGFVVNVSCGRDFALVQGCLSSRI
jgi:hypothetical protein